jgi:NTE family protein
MERYALVLGGGSHLGALQVGQLRALTEAGIEVDYMIGCSVGALNAAYMAGGFTPQRVETLTELWRDVAGDGVFDAGVKRAWSILRQRQSLSRPDRIVAVIDRASPTEQIQDLPIALEIVTCNLTQGRVEYHHQGDLRTRLAASSAIPGLLPPVTIDGDVHVDGGVVDILPWRRALQRRPGTPVIVLDCHSGRHWQPTKTDSALSVLLSSFALARRHGSHDGIDNARDIVVLPGIDTDGVDSFAAAAEQIDAAYTTTREFIDAGGLTVGGWRHEAQRAVRRTAAKARRQTH